VGRLYVCLELSSASQFSVREEHTNDHAASRRIADLCHRSYNRALCPIDGPMRFHPLVQISEQ